MRPEDMIKRYAFADVAGEYLSHFGIPKMQWGIRRSQNKDGSLTPAGRERYRKNAERMNEINNKGPEHIKQKDIKKYSRLYFENRKLAARGTELEDEESLKKDGIVKRDVKYKGFDFYEKKLKHRMEKLQLLLIDKKVNSQKTFERE